MKRTCLQKNTNTDEHSDAHRHCELHRAEISIEEQHLDPKEIEQVKSFVLMKNKILFILLIVVGVNLAPTQSMAQEETPESNWSYGVNTGFSNKYLWKGIAYNNGLVFQPEVWVGYSDFSFSLWSNTTLYDVEGVTAHEIDYTLDYSHSFEKFDFETWLSYYQYIEQEGVPNTAEWYFGAFYHVDDFTPFVDASVDVLDAVGATFMQLGCSYDIELNEKLLATATVLTGMGSKKFNLTYLEMEKGALNLVGGNVGLSYSISDNLAIDANYYLNFFTNSEVRNYTGKQTNAIELVLRMEF